MRVFQTLRDKWSSFLATEKEKTKNMTGKEKLSYFATYYKLEAFCVLLVIALIAFAVRSCIYLGKECVMYLGIVDTYMSSDDYNRFCDDFMKFVDDPDKSHYMTLDTTIYKSGTIIPEDVYNTDTTYQEKTMLLLGSGLVDAYICPDLYVEYLLVNEDLATVEETLGDVKREVYQERLAYDGHAIRLDPEWLSDYVSIGYEPVYLVFTYNNHFPEVTKALAEFIIP